ncbi:hypothetical protein ABMZ06_18530, partial [Pseudomonas aeruginosa]|uniref:hypothetical protein n=1 Tax=Pseudomonas aeruginosa TaxID=287 RepID=UPI0039E07B9D
WRGGVAARRLGVEVWSGAPARGGGGGGGGGGAAPPPPPPPARAQSVRVKRPVNAPGRCIESVWRSP